MAKKRVKAKGIPTLRPTKAWASSSLDSGGYAVTVCFYSENAGWRPQRVMILDARDYREMKAELNRLRKIIVHVEANACLGCRTRLGNAFAYAGAKKQETKR